MVCLSMEEREPGKALILQALLSHWHERELVVVLLQKEAALGSCPRAQAAGTELAWGHTKQMCTGRESPAKHKWHKVGFVIAALIVTTCASLQWNTDLSWALGGTHLGAGAKHCTVLQGMAVKMHPWTSGTPTLSLKKGISGHRISCFGDVNLDKLQCGCGISDAKYTLIVSAIFSVAFREEEAGEGSPSSLAGAEIQLLKLKNDRMCKQIPNPEQTGGAWLHTECSCLSGVGHAQCISVLDHKWKAMLPSKPADSRSLFL